MSKHVITVQKTVKLPEPIDTRLRLYCAEINESQQDIMVLAIEHYLDEWQDQTRLRRAARRGIEQP
jgi:hypothetical protein